MLRACRAGAFVHVQGLLFVRAGAESPPPENMYGVEGEVTCACCVGAERRRARHIDMRREIARERERERQRQRDKETERKGRRWRRLFDDFLILDIVCITGNNKMPVLKSEAAPAKDAPAPAAELETFTGIRCVMCMIVENT